jgi:hypothetical protein
MWSQFLVYTMGGELQTWDCEYREFWIVLIGRCYDPPSGLTKINTNEHTIRLITSPLNILIRKIY